jgi:Recombination endonuclease VII
MKLCKKCLVEKNTIEFYSRTYASGNKGYRPYCKGCCDRIHTNFVYTRMYGLGDQEIPLKPSSGAICNMTGKIVLDHDHDTKKFRGWICDRCNRCLGLLKDDPTLLRKAVDYLERSK